MNRNAATAKAPSSIHFDWVTHIGLSAFLVALPRFQIPSAQMRMVHRTSGQCR